MAKRINPYPEICQRLELVAGTAAKFYTLEFQPNEGNYLITYGRIGKTGQKIVYTADKAYAKFEEKLKEGYKIVKGGVAIEPRDIEYKAAPREIARFETLKAASPEELLVRHGSKVVQLGSLDSLLSPVRKGLKGADGTVFPGLHGWLSRLGSEGRFKVAEIWENCTRHEGEEPTRKDAHLAFCLVLAASDLV